MEAEPVKKTRLQFDFSPEALERLEELMVDLHASSKAEVIRRALLLLDNVMDSKREGASLQLCYPSGKIVELVLI